MYELHPEKNLILASAWVKSEVKIAVGASTGISEFKVLDMAKKRIGLLLVLFRYFGAIESFSCPIVH